MPSFLKSRLSAALLASALVAPSLALADPVKVGFVSTLSGPPPRSACICATASCWR